MEHKTANFQDNTREVIAWADHVRESAMLIAAAGVLNITGSQDMVANTLWYAGFVAEEPSVEELDAGASTDPEDHLQAWVEREQENILRAVDSYGLLLAGNGRLMKPPGELTAEEDQ